MRAVSVLAARGVAARALSIVVLLAPLAGCASERRLEASWEQFEREYDPALERASRVCTATAERARARGDDRLLISVTEPPASPVARLLWASNLAGVAYLEGDRAALDRALVAMREIDEEVAGLERQLVP